MPGTEVYQPGGSGGGGGEAADADLDVIAALDSSTAGIIATDGSGWFRKTYAALKTALSLVKGDVGLGNVTNTADTAKVIAGDVTGTLGASVLAGTANVEAIIRLNTLDQMGAPAANVDMGAHQLKSLADATAATDALNRQSGDARYPVLGNVTVNVQAFATGSGNWTKPPNALWVRATIIGGGAGGGSGRCGVTSSERHGGSGGGAGGVVDVEFSAADLGTTEPYVVGAGGAGGAAVGPAAADGIAGGVGGGSSFASVVGVGASILGITGGAKGSIADPATACTGGRGTRVTQIASTTLVGPAGGLALIAAGQVGVAGDGANCPGGGGAGGSITAANGLIAAKAGGVGGNVSLPAGTAGAPGTSGTAPTRVDHVGPGGGGGTAQTSSASNGAAGGAGLRGGGGAGGGAGTSGGTGLSGAGGNGGDGYVLVVTYCAR